MSKNNNIIIKIIKFIDYCWLDNFIANTLSHSKITSNDINYSWFVFSNKYYNENSNILSFIRNIKKHHGYNSELLLITINLFESICRKHAHCIENYTCLFAAIYIAINRIFVEEYLSFNFLSEFFNFDTIIARKMVENVDLFIYYNDIFFGLEEQNMLMKKILYN